MRKNNDNHILFIIIVTFLSGVCLFHLGIGLQVVLHEFRDFVYSNVEGELAPPTRFIFNYLAHRPESFLSQVIVWFFWPILLSGIYSIMKHRKCPEKVVGSFLMGFTVSWMALICFLSILMAFCVFPFICLIADLSNPPAGTKVITLISYALPILSLFLSIFWWFKSRRSKDYSLRSE